MISHKETWCDLASPSGYASIGGFPFHLSALSSLFDQTDLIVTLRKTPLPSGTIPLTGHNLAVYPLPEPIGSNLRRKFALLLWLPRHLPLLWRAIRHADAIHTPVPGDIGLIGLVIALIQHKPLFVRHCSTWGEPVTFFDHLLIPLLERIAGGRNVVLATGASEKAPSKKNPNISWIFSTTLSHREMVEVAIAKPWSSGNLLRLVTVCRLTPEKNVQAIIQAIPQLQEQIPNISLDVVGDGEYRRVLEKLAQDLNLLDRITFHGNVSHYEVLNVLSHSHIFVFPTQVKEGFPKALLEALSCGLPVVATNISVIPNLIQNCGVVLKDTGSDEVAKGILALVSDENHLTEMSHVARERALCYTLESWRDIIGERLRIAWGKLRSDV